jgi:hypothetical protein
MQKTRERYESEVLMLRIKVNITFPLLIKLITVTVSFIISSQDFRSKDATIKCIY